MKKRFLFLGALLLSLGLFFVYRIFQPEIYWARLPIDLVESRPMTQVIIEETSYPFLIDTGSVLTLTMREELLNKHQKVATGFITIHNMKGDLYRLDAYILPKALVRNMTAKNIAIFAEPPHYLESASIGVQEEKTEEEKARIKAGSIGWNFFVQSSRGILLDFARPVMYLNVGLKDLVKQHYKLTNWVKVPFELNRDEGLLIHVETDFGIKTFLVDTGATYSVIKSCVQQEVPSEPGCVEFCRSSKFTIGKKDFGPWNFVLYEMGEIFEKIDGVIGMDFLKTHIVYIDFEKRVAYFGNA